MANSKSRFSNCIFVSVYNIEVLSDTGLYQNTMVIKKKNMITVSIRAT